MKENVFEIPQEAVCTKMQYDTPFAQIVIFPQQDILTMSNQNGPIILPDDDWT